LTKILETKTTGFLGILVERGIRVFFLYFSVTGGRVWEEHRILLCGLMRGCGIREMYIYC